MHVDVLLVSYSLFASIKQIIIDNRIGILASWQRSARVPQASFIIFVYHG